MGNKKPAKAKPTMSPEETAIREQAKQLKIDHWWNKPIGELKQLVLDKRAELDNPVETTTEEDTNTSSDTNDDSELAGAGEEKTYTQTEVEAMMKAQKGKNEKVAKTFNENVKDAETEGNKGFKEAAKEENLYPFANAKGDRIGMYRKINKEIEIKPGKPDSSYIFVRWSDEKPGTIHADKSDVTIPKEDYNKMQAELEMLRRQK